MYHATSDDFLPFIILKAAQLERDIPLSEDSYASMDRLEHEATYISELASQYVLASGKECDNSEGLGNYRDFLPLGIQPRRLPCVTDDNCFSGGTELFIATLVYREYLCQQLGISEHLIRLLAAVFADGLFKRVAKKFTKLRANLMTVEEKLDLWPDMLLILTALEKMEDVVVLEGMEWQKFNEMKDHLFLYLSYYSDRMPMDQELWHKYGCLMAIQRMAMGFDFSQGLLDPGPLEDPLGLGSWRSQQGNSMPAQIHLLQTQIQALQAQIQALQAQRQALQAQMQATTPQVPPTIGGGTSGEPWGPGEFA
jgi:hypothetical protein